jgi:acetoin utilization protein AcuB
MLVRDWMTRSPQTVGADETLHAAFEKMAAGQFRRLPVMQGPLLVGILTDRDLRRYEGKLRYTAVRVAMSEKPLTLSPDDTLERAARLMIEHKFGGLPVVEGSDIVGVLTTTDVLRAFLAIAER